MSSCSVPFRRRRRGASNRQGLRQGCDDALGGGQGDQRREQGARGAQHSAAAAGRVSPAASSLSSSSFSSLSLVAPEASVPLLLRSRLLRPQVAERSMIAAAIRAAAGGYAVGADGVWGCAAPTEQLLKRRKRNTEGPRKCLVSLVLQLGGAPACALLCHLPIIGCSPADPAGDRCVGIATGRGSTLLAAEQQRGTRACALTHRWHRCSCISNIRRSNRSQVRCTLAWVLRLLCAVNSVLSKSRTQSASAAGIAHHLREQDCELYWEVGGEVTLSVGGGKQVRGKIVAFDWASGLHSVEERQPASGAAGSTAVGKRIHHLKLRSYASSMRYEKPQQPAGWGGGAGGPAAGANWDDDDNDGVMWRKLTLEGPDDD